MVTVSRESVMQDTIRRFSQLNFDDLQKRLKIVFQGEEGKDFKGLAREWLNIISHQISDVSSGYFEKSTSAKYALHVSETSLLP